MSGLRETQAAFRAALLGGERGAAVRDVIGDGLAPEARVAIYRHHVSATLTDLLKDVYPVVCRLVDVRFFAYAADRFIALHPPTSPCLVEYGTSFADFLARFAPCRHLVYLPDVARLEWAMSHAGDAADVSPLDPRVLGAVRADDLDRLTLRFQPSLTLLRSPWPIDRIWQANQPDSDPGTTVDLHGAPARLQIWRRENVVVMRALSCADFVFRLALADGGSLSASARIARSADPGFDLVAALSELFHDAVLMTFTFDKEERP